MTPEALAVSKLVGQGVGSLRTQCGLSQKELAQALGWEQQKVSAVENGRRIGVYEFVALRDYFMERLELPQAVVDEKLVSGGATPILRLVADTDTHPRTKPKRVSLAQTPEQDKRDLLAA